jgi:hypothetical protein
MQSADPESRALRFDRTGQSSPDVRRGSSRERLSRPDATWGESVTAAIVLREGTNATAHDLIAFCRTKLTHYKCPRGGHFDSEIARVPSTEHVRDVATVASHACRNGGVPRPLRSRASPREARLPTSQGGTRSQEAPWPELVPSSATGSCSRPWRSRRIHGAFCGILSVGFRSF